MMTDESRSPAEKTSDPARYVGPKLSSLLPVDFRTVRRPDKNALGDPGHGEDNYDGSGDILALGIGRFQSVGC